MDIYVKKKQNKNENTYVYYKSRNSHLHCRYALGQGHFLVKKYNIYLI